MEDTDLNIYQGKIEKAQELYTHGNIAEALSLLDEPGTEAYEALPLIVKMKMTSLRGIIYLNQGELKKAEHYNLLSLELAKQ
jgi:hypothetical protein